MRKLILGLAVAAMVTPALAGQFKLSSTDVKSGSPMHTAQVYTACNGQNVSPALAWSGEPAGTQSFAITMFDPDARGGAGWWHWAMFNIPASVHALPAGAGQGSPAAPEGAIQGRNDFGSLGYAGPCPPSGDHAHHYEITIYALKTAQLPLDGADADAEIGRAVQASALASAKIVGRYGR
jgi:Raf kinase inhibitor-like YbhB/YbcL family protein